MFITILLLLSIDIKLRRKKDYKPKSKLVPVIGATLFWGSSLFKEVGHGLEPVIYLPQPPETWDFRFGFL